MRKNEIQLSDAELEIMNIIWQAQGELSTAQILKSEACAEWKRTTVSTFLSRLVEKGAICQRKEGVTCYYSALLDKADYREKKTKSFIKSFYDGSAKALALSLFKNSDLTKEDLAELREMFLKDDGND